MHRLLISLYCLGLNCYHFNSALDHPRSSHTIQLKKNGLKTLIAKSPIRDALADRLFRASDVEITLSGASWRGSANELKGAE